MGFSEEELNELKEKFELFDMIGDGNIPKKDVGLVVRAMGKCPTEADLDKILKKIGAKDTITFDHFTSIMSYKMKLADPEELVESLKVFDKENNGKIASAELKHILCKMGERLTDREVNEVLEDADIVDGQIDYENFISALLERYVV